jgi:hypothetical protein
VFLSPAAAISRWSSHGEDGGVALIFIRIFVGLLLLTTWVLGILLVLRVAVMSVVAAC